MFDGVADYWAVANYLWLSPAFLPGAWCPFERTVRDVLDK